MTRHPLILGGLLVALAYPSIANAQPEPAPEDDFFVDRAGLVRRFDETYAEWSPDRYPAHYGRAALEMGGILALGTGWYWIKAETNSEDWDFPSLKERVYTMSAVRFDNNLYVTNHILHPAAGTAYYGFARVNRLGPYPAIGYSIASSAFFEWGLEFLEKVSINDLIYTPMGAWASGEFFFTLGDYLNSAPGGGGLGNRIGALTIGLPRYVHDRIDDVPPPPVLPADNLGFSTAFWHRFGIAYGLAGIDDDRGRSELAHDVLLEAELVRMPGFLRPGHFEKQFNQGNFVEMRTRMTFDHQGWADLDLFFSADIGGYYHQSFVSAPGGIRGDAFSASVNTSWRFVDRWLLGRRDGRAIAHLFGPAVRGWFGFGPTLVRGSIAAHLDFAGIRSLPYREWVARYGSEGTKTVLQNHSYYFAFGGSAVASASIEHAGTELGGRIGYGRYDSIEGLDREQEAVFRDVHNTDSVLEIAGYLGHTTPEAPLHVRVTFEQTNRWSYMPPLEETRWDRRIALSVGSRF